MTILSENDFLDEKLDVEALRGEIETALSLSIWLIYTYLNKKISISISKDFI